MEESSHRAHTVGYGEKPGSQAPSRLALLAAENRVDDDGRKKPQRAQANRRQESKGCVDAELRQFVRRQRAEIPDQPQDRGSGLADAAGVRPARRTIISSIA